MPARFRFGNEIGFFNLAGFVSAASAGDPVQLPALAVHNLKTSRKKNRHADEKAASRPQILRRQGSQR